MKTGLNTKEDLPMEKQVGLTGQEVEERIRSGQVNRMENHMVKTNKEIVKAHLLTYFNFLNLFLAILFVFFCFIWKFYFSLLRLFLQKLRTSNIFTKIP